MKKTSPNLGHPSRTPRPNTPGGSSSQTDDLPVPPIGAITLHPMNRAGNLVGFASVTLGVLTTHGWRIVHPQGQRPWVGVPANAKEEHDPATGERRRQFFPVLEMPTSWRKAVETAVLAKWAEREVGQ